MSEGKLHERVNGEWSLVETQRRRFFARDASLGNAVLEEEVPYHPSGFLPQAWHPTRRLTLDAIPRPDEVLAPQLARLAAMRRVVNGLTEAEPDRVRSDPTEPYPDQAYAVR